MHFVSFFYNRHYTCTLLGAKNTYILNFCTLLGALENAYPPPLKDFRDTPYISILGKVFIPYGVLKNSAYNGGVGAYIFDPH